MDNIKTILRGLLNRTNKKGLIDIKDLYNIRVEKMWPGCKNREMLKQTIENQWISIISEHGIPESGDDIRNYFGILRDKLLNNLEIGATIPSRYHIIEYENAWRIEIVFKGGLKLCDIVWDKK